MIKNKGQEYFEKKFIPKFNHITIIGQNKKISEAYTYVKDGKEWVSAMPRPAKDYEIYDTVKKALEVL